MKREPPKPPNPVIQKIEESKTLKTKDDPRLQPQERPPAPGMAPSGAVGTERTERQKQAEIHNAKIKERVAEREARQKGLEMPGGLTREFNKRI